MYKPVIALLCLLLAIPCSFALSYDIIVNEQGEALVLVALEEHGTFQIPLPLDVKEVKAKGALYLIENQTLEIAVGSTKHAAILFKTNALTKKNQNEWSFSLDLSEKAQKVTLNLPTQALISETEPRTLIENSNYKKIIWIDPKEKVLARYSFSIKEVPDVADFNKNSLALNWVLISFGALILFGMASYFIFIKKPEKSANPDEGQIEISSNEGLKEVKNLNEPAQKNPDARTNIIKTLSQNEALIVTCILENNNAMKRNELERKTKLAKSSLASSLHNLEQKNIIVLDRTNTVHRVQLTEWFKNL